MLPPALWFRLALALCGTTDGCICGLMCSQSKKRFTVRMCGRTYSKKTTLQEVSNGKALP